MPGMSTSSSKPRRVSCEASRDAQIRPSFVDRTHARRLHAPTVGSKAAIFCRHRPCSTGLAVLPGARGESVSASRFVLKPLPYASDALSPWISAETVEFHYGKYHRQYVDSLNAHLLASRAKAPSLEALVREASGDVQRLASQVWNHDFFWSGLRAGGGGKPTGTVLACLDAAFGGFSNFRRRLATAANSHFGSGWAWLVLDGAHQIRVTTTRGAENPLRWGMRPLFAIDVWEHAYYLDVQNERQRYVEAVIDHLIDWEFVLGNLDHAMRPVVAVASGVHRKPIAAAMVEGAGLGAAGSRSSQHAASMQPIGSSTTIEGER